MGTDTYTFLKECDAIVDVNTSNFLEIRRNTDAEAFFSLNNVTFSNLHNTFKVSDSSIKWGLG